MNSKRRRFSKNKKSINENKVIRCKSRMIPVFENDTCEYFIKNEQAGNKEICKNCKYSF